MRGSWFILEMAVLMLIIGLILSEPTSVGLWHPLLGDSAIMVSIWYAIRNKENLGK